MKAAALPLLGVGALPFSRSVSLSSGSAIIRSFQLGDSVNPLLVLLLARPAVEEMNELVRQSLSGSAPAVSRSSQHC
jgi:hypothetical protein